MAAQSSRISGAKPGFLSGAGFVVALFLLPLWSVVNWLFITIHVLPKHQF
jgi:hypothetical protein